MALLTITSPQNSPVNFVINNTPNGYTSNPVLFLTSQYSHQEIQFGGVGGEYIALGSTNERYATLQLAFPVGFADEHKSGIYNWRIVWSGPDGPIYQNGLVKIITQPGGDLGIKEFISTPQTEERVSEVFYRPNY
tara:strand:+ start:878 stop:1282 length:405 start_codon:yes stop_codon:yes gene_type:complete